MSTVAVSVSKSLLVPIAVAKWGLPHICRLYTKMVIKLQFSTDKPGLLIKCKMGGMHAYSLVFYWYV